MFYNIIQFVQDQKNIQQISVVWLYFKGSKKYNKQIILEDQLLYSDFMIFQVKVRLQCIFKYFQELIRSRQSDIFN
ncbi:hypothetical protein pb186bvf_003080 [Paramecium bursaria]